MDLFGSLLTFAMFWKLSSSLQCYDCQPECSRFNTTNPKYITNCEHSTMCFKKISTLDFGNGVTSQNIQRGCAAQIMDGEQVKINRKWVARTTIHEVYEETCFDDPSNKERSTKTVFCYCRGDLCNSAKMYTSAVGLLALTIAVIVNS
ncbi:uncharacterized protein LOC142981525 [Anticarsia gemmatalis]|uniref:uncharacterized protein LOC142981525 n=1 Tax=Anticarsia gemmatalis TaxID=129554 RepID=UPI003F76E250